LPLLFDSAGGARALTQTRQRGGQGRRAPSLHTIPASPGDATAALRHTGGGDGDKRPGRRDFGGARAGVVIRAATAMAANGKKKEKHRGEKKK